MGVLGTRRRKPTANKEQQTAGNERQTKYSKEKNSEQQNKQRATNNATNMKTNTLRNQTNKRVSRSRAILGVITASLIFATAALAQMPPSPWKKGAPFPEPDEEFYGVTVNGKLYAIGGWGEGKARGANYEYDPASDKWTKKTSMPRPAHHAALAASNGKIYVRRLRRPGEKPVANRRRLATD